MSRHARRKPDAIGFKDNSYMINRRRINCRIMLDHTGGDESKLLRKTRKPN